MKNLRKIALPLAILLVGAGSAYATSVEKTKDAEKALVEKNGYRWVPDAPVEKCQLTEELCTTDNTGVICTVFEGGSSHNLFDGDGIPCEQVMHRIQ